MAYDPNFPLGDVPAADDPYWKLSTPQPPQVNDVGSALTGGDPLMAGIYNLGLSDVYAWNPEQEAARKKQSWGQTQQKVGERYSRAGLTGSSQELGDLSRTANQFELDWNERKPKQMESAIAATLPIQNFRRSVANDALTQANADRVFNNTEDSQDTALWGNLLASSGLPSWLSSVLFGTSTPAVGGTSAGGLVPQGLSAIYKALFGGGGTNADPNFDAYGQTFDWGGDVMPALAGGGDYSWLGNTLADNYWSDLATNVWGI